nr:hypothetical protein [Schwartzia sp. (in: firmicutes)]
METPALRKLKAEADLKEAKAKQEKIKLNVTEGKFLPVSEVQAETSRLLADFKKNILAMGHHVATQLATVASPEATEIARNEIDKRIKEALEELSKHGRISGRKGKKGQKKTAL